MLTAHSQNNNNCVDKAIGYEMNAQNETQLNIESIKNEESNEEVTPEVDITISNVVCSFSVRCHLNLRQIATHGSNVVYRREQAMISMKIRHPSAHASIWSSGKITCTGAPTEAAAKSAARKVARTLQKMGFKVKFGNYRVVNVLGSCSLPFGIKIHDFSECHRGNASYEPELHPGATYNMKDISAVLKVFQTGAITITAPSISKVQMAVERIYPLVYEFRKPKPKPKIAKPKDENAIKPNKIKKEKFKDVEMSDDMDDEIEDSIEVKEEEEDSYGSSDYSDKSDD